MRMEGRLWSGCKINKLINNKKIEKTQILIVVESHIQRLKSGNRREWGFIVTH